MNSLFTDCYEMTMANADFLLNKQNEIGYFEMFFRDIPEKGGYAIFAGLEKITEYLSNLQFSAEQLDYIKNQFDFCDEYLNALENFKFECDVWSVKEGSIIFPNEPIMVVRGPMWQAMLVEVALLNSVNYQSLIATKASRIVRAADGRKVIEFGARRAQGEDAALWGARASYIGGVDGVSIVEAGMQFDIPVNGTMAHSFMQKYDSDFEAFSAYAKAFPHNCVLLLDTFDTLKSGLPAAIRVQKEILEPLGKKLKAVRVDSGDLGYLAKQLRKTFDDAGMAYVQIIVSNALDEDKMRDLINDQKAPIDIFGVGENLITSSREPVFGGVYKLVAVELPDGQISPRIKISENLEKTTIPSLKIPYRIFDRETGKAIADIITLYNEEVPSGKYELFDPLDPTKRKNVKKFKAIPLLVPIFENGKMVYDLPIAEDIRTYTIDQMDTLWDEAKRFNYPHKHYVDLSQSLYDLRENMIKERRGQVSIKGE